MILSLVLIAISVLSLFVRGLSFGIDFTGGYVIEAGFEQPADLPQIRDKLSVNGFPEAVVQYFGTQKEVLVRLAPEENLSGAKINTQVKNCLLYTSPSPRD